MSSAAAAFFDTITMSSIVASVVPMNNLRDTNLSKVSKSISEKMIRGCRQALEAVRSSLTYRKLLIEAMTPFDSRETGPRKSAIAISNGSAKCRSWSSNGFRFEGFNHSSGACSAG